MKLPLVSGRKVIKALTKVGFQIVGRKGSHVRLKKKDGKTLITVVPDHKELEKGTLKAILRQANISVEEFLKLLERR
ncbi:MAG: type II toxin-antitoxin system HicA family toxin [Candidatus Hydrothermarchaeales archaeon]